MKRLKFLVLLLTALCSLLPNVLFAQMNWTQATPNAAWSPRFVFPAVVFHDTMWIMGGYGVAVSDVWYSIDGANWTCATSTAGWPCRLGHTAVVYANKMWVIGGCVTDANRYNDVWYSQDGINWTCANPNAPWSKRFGHTSVVFHDTMWVIGGYPLSNDVWYSQDGVKWTCATSSAPWSARFYHASVVFDGKIWVIGGESSGGVYKNDVWYSANGVVWIQAPNAEWLARRGPSSVVYDNKIWILGGFPSLMNDVWYSTGLGIEDNRHSPVADRLSLEVYPNPAKAYFTLRLPQSNGREQIKIFDVTGKVVKELESSGNRELRISLDGIKNGIYFVQVRDVLEIKKLVITK